MKLSIRLLKHLSLCALILPLAACDGGLFGTGDGGPIVPVNSGTPATTGGDTVGGEGGSDPSATPTAPGGNMDTTDQTNFENLDVSTRETEALVNVLNYSSSSLVVRVDTANTDSEVIAAGTNSPALRIAPDTRVLSLIDSDNVTVFTFDPFTTAAQSLSTIIIRESDTGIRVNAVRSEVATDDPAVAKVRVFQIGDLGDASRTGNISLQADGTNPGSTDVVFTGLDFNLNAVTDYVIAGSGDYVLTDTLDRFSPVPVTLEGGSVYTILLTGRAESAVLVIRDSDLAN